MKFLPATIIPMLFNVASFSTLAQAQEEDQLCIDCMEYETMNGEMKIDRIWERITSTEYEELPQDWVGLRDARPVNNPDLSYMVFDRLSDERPPLNRASHEYGSIAQIQWQPSKTTDHNFTGIFEEEDRTGIFRFSLCAAGFGGRTGTRGTNGFALKFVRDGIHSANWNVCEGSLGTDDRYLPSKFGAFSNDLSSIVAIPEFVKGRLANFSSFPGVLTIDDTAEFRQDGTRVPNALSPVALHFFPNSELDNQEEYPEDFRIQLKDIPVGTKLFTAFTAVDGEGNPNICTCVSTDKGDVPCSTRGDLEQKCNLVELGSIITKTRFYASEYGDTGIFFNHGQRPCDNSRTTCEYSGPVDSMFAPALNPNTTCISSFVDTDCVEDGGDQELISSSSGCAPDLTPEPTCPFARMLHESYFAEPSEDLDGEEVSKDYCYVAKDQRLDSLTSISCCLAIQDLLEGSDYESVCVIEGCKSIVEKELSDRFPMPIDELCNAYAPKADLKTCDVHLLAGGAVRPVDVGDVTESCCEAGNSYLNALISEVAPTLDEDLKMICGDPTCVQRLDPIYSIGQSFSLRSPQSAPRSADDLNSLCSSFNAGDNQESNPMDETKEESDESSAPFRVSILSTSTLLLIMTVLV